MFIADAHCDALYRIAIKGRAIEDCAVSPQRMRAGGMGLQTFAMYSSLGRPDPHADGLRMLAAYRALPLPRLDGALPEDPPDGPCAVLSMEGGEILQGKSETLDEFDGESRLRLIALTWNYENEIGTPAAKNAWEGLKPFGFQLLREMDRRGIAADVSHLNEAGFWDVMNAAEVAPLASHSNCRWLCDVPRNLSRAQVRALLERRGFIGINFYAEFLAQGREAVIEDVARHIDEICAMGGEEIVGFGSDFDGIDAWPKGLASPADYPRLLDLLARRGYTEKQLRSIAGRNYWRFLREAQNRAERRHA